MLKRNPWPVILQVIPELHIGGAERTVIEVAEAVRIAGGRALVLSEGGALERELQEVGGELLRFPAKTKNPALILTNAWRMARLIRDYNVSLVHARSRAPAWSALCAARRSARPFVTTYHGIYRQNGRLKAWYNGVMARGDAVIANSAFTARAILARHPVPAERLHVIPRGVDLDIFDPAAVSHERIAAVRRSWSVGNERVILLPARLTRWKGQHLLIEALARLRERRDLDGVRAIVAGDDQGRTGYGEMLNETIRKLGLGEVVRLVGYCRDMPAAFLTADLTVIPSLEEEAFGRVSVEAQAMGCPVIAADHGALPETLGAEGEAGPDERIRRMEGGWLFRANDAGALAEALDQALSLPPGQRLDMAVARERMTVSFSKRALQIRTLGVYDGLLGTQLVKSFKACVGP